MLLLDSVFHRKYNRSRAFVICDGETPVGIGLYYDCEELQAYDLSQLFIDARYQGRGYGKAATRLVLDAMRTDENTARSCFAMSRGTIRRSA